ncbi:MAG: hypothetical protein AAF194_09245, partial [Pseudomonadota bacterium]
MFAIFALQACLYVELYGPVTDASVSIRPLRGGEPILENGKSYSLGRTAGLFPEGGWEALTEFERLAFAGAVDVPKSELDDTTLYLVTVTGGIDRDFQQNGVLDQTGESILGTWHGIYTGAQLQEVVRVSALTEAAYQAVLEDIDSFTDEQLLAALDNAASRIVTNLDDRTDVVDYTDLLLWSGVAHADAFRGERFLIDRIRDDVRMAVDQEELARDSDILIQRASWKAVCESAPLAGQMVYCLSATKLNEVCSVSEFPLIGLSTADPTIDNLMDRLVVSHDWMAVRFRQIMALMPPEMLSMTRSLSAIVIGDSIRPSFFSPTSNAIFLDADLFWLTAEEEATVRQEADFRSEFQRRVDFAHLWDYVIDGESIFFTGSSTDSQGNRRAENIAPVTASLLFHELAHALDAIPPTAFEALDPELAPFQQDLTLLSDTLNNGSPLSSPELLGIARVLFFGEEPTETQRNFSAADIGGYFSGESANDLYSYSNQYEDLAM